MAPIDTSYYDLLEVPPRATKEELSSAYRKRALQLHPDKGGNEEQFKAMKAAYDILKDPQKRQLYDAHGPAIARAMDGEVAAMMEIGVSMLKKASRIVLCALPIIAGIVFLPAVILSLKLDDRIRWNWVVVFIPVWVAQLFLFLIALKLRLVLTSHGDSSPSEEDAEGDGADADAEDTKRRVKSILTLAACSILLTMIQEAAVAIRLQGIFNTSWFLVCFPYLLIEILAIHTSMSLTLSAPVEPAAGPARLRLLAPLVVWCLLRLSTVALLAAKADRITGMPWILCFVPLCIGCGARLLWACRKSPPADSDSAPAESDVLGACFAIASWLAILLLLAGKMDGSQYSAFLVFSPYFFFGGLMLCCCGCFAFCAPSMFSALCEIKLEETRTQQSDPEAARLSQTGRTQTPFYYSVEQSTKGPLISGQ